MEKVVDILKMAIENEIRSRVYYEKASRITQDGESQMLFLELTGMEKGHADLLVERFGDEFDAEGFDAGAFVNEREAEMENVLTVEQNAVIEGGDLGAVLDLAIGFEAHARDTYSGLIERVAKEAQREVLRALAAEEQKHHDMLFHVREDLDIPPEERAAL